MSTITKQWLQQTIAEYEANRDELPFGLDTNSAIELQAFKLALASIEAEPVAYIRSAHNPDGFCFADGIHPTHRHQRLPLSTLQDGCYWKVTPLYSAPPATVSVPDAYVRDGRGRMMLNGRQEPRIGYSAGWNACRAAMLQGAENAESRCTIQTAPVLDSLLKKAESRCSNSPMALDGWVACSERMPSAGEKVLAYRPDAPESNDPLIKMATYVGGSAHGHGFDCYCKPTHWMPLPAAPKQELK